MTGEPDQWYANDAHGGGIPTWGWQVEGAIEFPVGSGHTTEGVFLGTGQGTPTPVMPGMRVNRPPTGTGHFVHHLAVWWADLTAFAAGTSIDGIHDLYDADYLTTLDPVYPTGYSGDDVAPFLLPPPGAAFLTAAIQDEGPYDSSGTTIPVGTSAYAPYADITTAMANYFGVAPLTQLYLSFTDVFMTSEAEKRLQAVAQGLADPRIVPASHLSYEVDAYFVADGLPVADTALGIDAGAVVESGDLGALGAYPRPYTVDLGANTRWLPLVGTFDDGQEWAPFQGTDPIRLDADGSAPVLDDAYEYLLGAAFAVGPAMRMDGADYFLTDELRWGIGSVTVALVAVLATPLLDSYGLLETYPPDSNDPNRTFVGLRYTREGQVQTHIQGLQTRRQTASGAVRTGQPVVVALRIAGAVVDVAVVDHSLTHWTSSLTAPHPGDARLYVGRSPGVELGSADMDILEVGYWTDLDTPAMLALVNTLDGLYGVSR